jgi:HlyD family secretion protein
MINKHGAVWFVASLSVAAVSCATARAAESEAFQGVVEQEEQVVAFEVAGRVAEVHAQRGARVAASAPLATLDDTLERAARDSQAGQLDAAKAQAALVRAGPRAEEVKATEAQLRGARAAEALLGKNLERETALVRSGALAEAHLDDLRGRLDRAVAERESLEQRLHALRSGARRDEVRVAESAVASAQSAVAARDARLERHVLRAPSGGEVLDVHVDPGAVVAPGSPVVTLADTARPYVDVFVPLGRSAAVQRGAEVAVRVDGDPEVYRGHVEHISRRTEFTPRYLFSDRERPNLVLRVRVRLEDPNRRLHAGVPAFVTVLSPGGAR